MEIDMIKDLLKSGWKYLKQHPILFVLPIAFLFPNLLPMGFLFVGAIGFNAATNRSSTTGTSITITHTAAGSNRYVVVAFMVKTNDTATGVTYDGTAMTQVNKEDNTTNDSWIYMYALHAPSLTDPANVVGSSSASVVIDMCCASYTGCQQTTPPDAQNDLYETGSGSRTVSVTTVADNCWLVCTQTSSSANPTAAVNGTLRTADLLSVTIIDSNSALTPPGAKTIGFNWPSSDDHTISALSIAPVAAAAANPHMLSLTGVGA